MEFPVRSQIFAFPGSLDESPVTVTNRSPFGSNTTMLIGASCLSSSFSGVSFPSDETEYTLATPRRATRSPPAATSNVPLGLKATHRSLSGANRVGAHACCPDTMFQILMAESSQTVARNGPPLGDNARQDTRPGWGSSGVS